MNLTSKDRVKLNTCHPHLRAVIVGAAAITTVPFMIMETGRTLAQQRKNIAKGVSQTLKSRHLISADGFCRAADVVPIDAHGNPIWAWPVYYRLAPIIKRAAITLKIPVEWGGDWKSFKDGPHWQLPWKQYP